MNKLRVLSMLMVGSMLVAGCATKRIYGGSRQPGKMVSRIKPGAAVRVQSVDGTALALADQRNTWLLVLPGEHELGLTSSDSDLRVFRDSNNVEYVRRVLLTPEEQVKLKFSSGAGAKYLVQYQRTQDEATYSVVNKETGQAAGVVTAKLKMVNLPLYGPYPHYGPYFYGPGPGPGPIFWGPPHHFGPHPGPW